jgi:hypothetical protein
MLEEKACWEEDIYTISKCHPINEDWLQRGKIYLTMEWSVDQEWNNLTLHLLYHMQWEVYNIYSIVFCLTECLRPGVMAHSYNPTTQKTGARGEFEARLGYIVNLRPA